MTKGNKLSKDEALDLYKKMFTIRRMEEKLAELYSKGLIAGFLHLYIGQEAIATGLFHIASNKDSSITTYRDHAHAFLSKIEVKAIIAELLGKETGASKGRGGSMHFYNKAERFYGGQGIVGSSVPLGAGLALAHKITKDTGVAMAYFGDGALVQGQVAETLNLAQLFKLPLVFVLENNHYAMGTSVERNHSNTDLSAMAKAYNIKVIDNIDGMNILDVMEKGQEALDYARSGKGPVFMNIWTYRYRGHSMSDPGKYRTREEVEEVKETRDPINLFIKYINENNIAKEEDLKNINKEVEKLIEEATEFAINSKEPELSTLYDHILKAY